MINSTPFGSRSTADQVLAGVDLTGKHFVVTGCNSGLGFETMNSLAANGAQVIGLARNFEAAKTACARASRACVSIECDLSDLDAIQGLASKFVEKVDGCYFNVMGLPLSLVYHYWKTLTAPE